MTTLMIQSYKDYEIYLNYCDEAEGYSADIYAHNEIVHKADYGYDSAEKAIKAAKEIIEDYENNDADDEATNEF